MDEWQYHQDGRDRAADTGAIGCLSVLCFLIALMLVSCG